MFRGFITQASYRVATDANARRRPVIQIYGRLEDGASFLVRDDRQRPHFYIRVADLERARAAGAPAGSPTTRRTFDGTQVARIEVEAPGDGSPVRGRPHAAGTRRRA